MAFAADGSETVGSRDDDLYDDRDPDEEEDVADDSIDADLFDDEYDESPEYDEVPCPSCGALISEEAPKCPHCGDWVIERSEASRRSATWFWPILIVLMILGFVMLYLR